MKAVVFVCLLSLSVCLSESTSKQADLTATNATSGNKTATEKTPDVPPQQNTTELAPKSQPAANGTTSTKTPTSNSTETGTAVSGPVTLQNSTAPAVNKTEAIVTPNNETATETLKPDPSKDKTMDEKKMGEKNNTAPVTEKVVPTETKTTEAPKAATEKPLVAARGFDGASFIGGIILTLGLLAIGFMGFKYYKNQTERNYHTL